MLNRSFSRNSLYVQLLVFWACIPVVSFSQFGSTFPEIFFTRLPSARAEAMGKAYTSLDGDLGSVHYNPAGLATIRGVQGMATVVPPTRRDLGALYTFSGVASNFGKYLTIAISNFRYDFGNVPVFGATKRLFTQRAALSFASEPIKSFAVGVNINYFSHHPGFDKPSGTMYFDFGCLKSFNFHTNRQTHAITVGGSISNFTKSIVNLNVPGSFTKYELPIIIKYGVNYQTSFGNIHFIDSTPTFKLLLQSDFQKLINSDYQTAIRVGGEILIFNLLALRLGYFVEKWEDFGFPDINRSPVQNVTYGGGVSIPVDRLTALPIKLYLDYTSLPGENYRRDINNQRRFTSVSVRLEYSTKRVSKQGSK